MSNAVDRFAFLKGILSGFGAVAGTLALLLLVDSTVHYMFARPLFNRPHTLGLLVLATTMIIFRMLVKKGVFEAGKGFFLAIFLSTIAYLFYHKLVVLP